MVLPQIIRFWDVGILLSHTIRGYGGPKPAKTNLVDKSDDLKTTWYTGGTIASLITRNRC